jgi:hypothetical protein
MPTFFQVLPRGVRGFKGVGLTSKRQKWQKNQVGIKKKYSKSAIFTRVCWNIPRKPPYTPPYFRADFRLSPTPGAPRGGKLRRPGRELTGQNEG